MKPAWWPGLASLLALACVLGLSPRDSAAGAPAADSAPGVVLDRLTDLGSSIRLGFGVSPLHGVLAPTPANVPGVQESETGTVVSFDLNLAWPGSARSGTFVPYLILGPALFVVEPDSAGRLLGTRPDSTVQLGARAGAGVNWRVGDGVTLFGGYELTTTAPGGLGMPGSRPPDPGSTGHDFSYGLRFTY